MVPAGARGLSKDDSVCSRVDCPQCSNPLEVSAALNTAAGQRWISSMKEAGCLLGGIYSVMHPALAEAGFRYVQTVTDNATGIEKGHLIAGLAEVWTLPFVSMSIMVNRETPLHRDNGGAPEWLDVLLPLGTYADGYFNVPGLGRRFHYSPGDLVGLAGRILRHSAECNGNRACIAFYMRKNVFSSLGLPHVGWAQVDKS
jgi:hypothetical protein